ncbi:NAD(P)/FAD-dependent oxidoreductase [Georgenia alba]|uniref:NAD(P)/FAD-dependent oxidoreductase n=1 Tax=Georgenia alba TaxID=2233858 RepID=A0ABW2Q7W9_9MICO
MTLNDPRKDPRTDPLQILVLGAGYAGVLTAQRLAKRLHAEEVVVTVVSAFEEFVERPRLHQIAAWQRVPRLALADLFAGLPVRRRTALVAAIDTAHRRVVLADGTHLAYDTLVVGLGSQIDAARTPGAAEHAVVLTDAAAAEGAAARTAALAKARGTVVVCGGGLTGIEIAAELAETWPDLTVRLVSSAEAGGWLSARGRAYLGTTLDRLGVERVRGRVARVEAGVVHLEDGTALTCDEVYWAGGFRASPLVAEAGLAVDRAGRAVVDRTLRSVSHPEVFVVGDAAAVPGPWGDALAMGCRTGTFTGPTAAERIVADLTGRESRPLRFRYLHECLSLGRRQGLVQLLDAEGRPHERILTGRLAMAYKDATLNGAKVLFRHPAPVLRKRATARTARTRLAA